MTVPHPDDESLSAALDGDDAAAADHVSACPTCRARTDALRAAAEAVGAGPVVAVPYAGADRAVAAALGAFAAERATVAPRRGTVGDGDIVALRAAATRPPGSFTSRRSTPTSGRGRRVPSWAMGVAAALLAVLVAVPLLTRDTGGDGEQTAAAKLESGAQVSTTFASGAPVVDGGDLGDQSDQLALGTLLTGAVTGATGPTPAPALAADQATTAVAAEGAGPARSASPGAEGGAAPAGGTGDTAAPDAVAVAACQRTVGIEYATGLGTLLYRATLRWQGIPAVLLAYRLADTSANGPDHRAFVMALDGCRLLVVQGF